MPTPTTESRQDKKDKAEMMKTWMSYQWLLKESLEIGDKHRLQSRLQSLQKEAMYVGVRRSYSDSFIERHMDELTQIVDREREARERAKRAGSKNRSTDRSHG